MREVLLKDYLFEIGFELSDLDPKGEIIFIDNLGGRVYWTRFKKGVSLLRLFQKPKKIDVMLNLRDDRDYKIKFDSSLDRPEFVELINNKLDEFPYDSWLSFAHERNTSSANYYFSVKNEKYKSELSYIALTFITEVSLKLN
tara:strand:+ start:558 stop:983 length:426 start_codon:yes stop_codon:yes gene_type:complete